MLKEVQQSVRDTEDLRANAQVLLWPLLLLRISVHHFSCVKLLFKGE